jgi:small-conductance mechanosensitive channel
MTYRRAFRVGELVKIGEHIGNVEQIRLLVTHLRTKKNEEVIIPNSSILGSEVINYSSMANARGLILHTTTSAERAVLEIETPAKSGLEQLRVGASRDGANLPQTPASSTGRCNTI